MKSSNELRTMLRAVDRKSYPAYKSLAGAYQFGNYVLVIDHVQGDPFASPSSVHVEVPHKAAGFPVETYETDCARIALQDFLNRQFYGQVDVYNFKAKGSGKSGLLSITRCGQEVLERSACQITKSHIIARFSVGFPAFGRTIDAGGLEKILFDFLPNCVENSFFYQKLNRQRVQDAVWLAEDQKALRDILKQEGWAAFVANGAILPRRSGVSDMPMKDSTPFVSPASMERIIRLPHRGDVKGMAIPRGITLIVGGGYHGKSTLLSALQMGVYNHIAGDGRELVITDDTAVKLRAEEGRSIRNMDISLFINDLPNKKDTHRFSTEDASGSTSQAAGVMEGVEAGSGLFLIDEDTSATNFMVRDDFMQQVISREKEPITPFLERARDLYEKAGVSTILVAGSSGAFFYIADQILQMDCYRPVDITERVKGLLLQHKEPRTQAPGFVLPDYKDSYGTSGISQGQRDGAARGQRYSAEQTGAVRGQRYSAKQDGPASGQRYGGRGEDARGQRYGGERGGRGGESHGGRGGENRRKIKTFGRDSFSIDRETVDLRYVEQLADSEQTQGLAYLLRYALEQVIDGRKSVSRVVQVLDETLESRGWEPFCGSYIPCGLAKPRRQEIFACLNRYRGQV